MIGVKTFVLEIDRVRHISYGTSPPSQTITGGSDLGGSEGHQTASPLDQLTLSHQ